MENNICQILFFNEKLNDGRHQSFAHAPKKKNTKDHAPSSIVQAKQFEEGWESYGDVLIDHANPLEVINLEHAKDNTILGHDTTTHKAYEFEDVFPFEITLHEKDLENS